METAIYYVLCAMTLGGALGVILARGYVNAAMSMLLSMLGAAGMMVMMGAYFVAFIMVSVYAGAVLVLFVRKRTARGSARSSRSWGSGRCSGRS